MTFTRQIEISHHAKSSQVESRTTKNSSVDPQRRRPQLEPDRHSNWEGSQKLPKHLQKGQGDRHFQRQTSLRPSKQAHRPRSPSHRWNSEKKQRKDSGGSQKGG